MAKVFISGTSGIGKTTLAQHISEAYKIPFINGSSTVLWKAYGISSHKELLEMGIREPERGLAFQYELLKVRESLCEPYAHFVTDRSIIDNIVYFLYQNSPYLSQKQTREYIKTAIKTHQRIITKERMIADTQSGYIRDILIYLSRDFYPHDVMPKIEDDSKRVINEYFQDVMDSVFKLTINEILGKDIPFSETWFMRDYNFEKRIRKVNELYYGR